MSTTYAQKSSTVQKVADSKAASLFDSSSQSESLQRKANMANAAAQRAEAPRPNNTGMPDNLKSGIESLSGFSMDDVRVHYNSSKPATVQALAYTQGTDIHVAPGQEKHLPHEAWHVAQQMAGRVSPTTNINGMPVNDNAALEHEADVMGAKATQMKSDESKTVQRATIWNGVAQRVELKDYYYHISGGEIDGDINPKRAIQQGRTRDGDDLGPGFYMGDSNFLPYYYGENFLDKPSVYIYYIEKKLIDENLKTNIMDFTDENETNKYGLDSYKLFQIAMELGFKDESGNIALDFLAPENVEDSEKFKMVAENHGDDAKKAIPFFIEANKKAIWQGYINDVHRKVLDKVIIKNEDIKNFFEQNNVEKTVAEKLADAILKDTIICKSNIEFTKFRNDSKRIIINMKETLLTVITFEQYLNLQTNYVNFLEGKAHFNPIYMGKETGATPIQIAIRQNIEDLDAENVEVEDVEGIEDAKDVKPVDGAKEAKDTLLGKIKGNKIPITDTEIESTRKLIVARTESETNGDAKNEGPKPEPLKPAETEPVTNGDAKNEESKQELLKTAGTESATSKDLKSELNAAGTESNVSDDLKNEIKIAFAKEKEKRSQK